MRIVVNNEEVATDVATIAALADELGLPNRGVALAVNNRVVLRSTWETTALHEGDHVTIVKAAFGG